MDSAKLFQNGKSQAVRLPKAYRFHGSKVYIKRMGNAIVLIPEHEFVAIDDRKFVTLFR